MVALCRLGSDRLAADDDSPWRDRLSRRKSDRTAGHWKSDTTSAVDEAGPGLVAMKGGICVLAPDGSLSAFHTEVTVHTGTRLLRSHRSLLLTEWLSANGMALTSWSA